MSQTRPTTQGPELVFGLVGPLGCDLDAIYHSLEDALASVGYESELIHLSDLLRETKVWEDLKQSGWEKEIEHKQRLGNLLRAKSNRPDALAICGIRDIRRKRAAYTGNEKTPAPRRAYIIRQLKNPAEVQCLRRVYGEAFFLIGLYSSKIRRLEYARGRIRTTPGFTGNDHDAEERARPLIERDEKEEDFYGQNTRDTFPEADLFVTDESNELLKLNITRFIELLFGHPFHTPWREEYLMYQATGASLRSSDMGRQVGAVIASVDGDVVSIGANEVPKVTGGLIWDGDSPDRRDYKYKGDPSIQHKKDLIKNLFEILRVQLENELKNHTVESLLQNVGPHLMKSKLMGIQEFGRPVHAEMAALLDAAMRGVAVKGNIIYVTAFPCHNCAKHLVAAGILAVVFLEPYPKSLVTSIFEHEFKEELQPTNLHGWNTLLGREGSRQHTNSTSVALCAYLGVAPRRYLQLFKMVERKNADGRSLEDAWIANKRHALLRVPTSDAHISYLPREEQEVGVIANFFAN